MRISDWSSDVCSSDLYAINAGQLQLAPAPTDATVIAMTYWQSIPALTSSNTTNWLMTANPDVYLLGCLVAAELRGWNDERLQLIKSALDEMLTEIDVEGTKKRGGASPILPRRPKKPRGGKEGR